MRHTIEQDLVRAAERRQEAELGSHASVRLIGSLPPGSSIRLLPKESKGSARVLRFVLMDHITRQAYVEGHCASAVDEESVVWARERIERSVTDAQQRAKGRLEGAMTAVEREASAPLPPPAAMPICDNHFAVTSMAQFLPSDRVATTKFEQEVLEWREYDDVGF